MRQTAAIDSIPGDVVAFDETVTVEVNLDFQFSVDNTYLTVPPNGVGTVEVVITMPEMNVGSSVRLDDPPISFFGDQPNAVVERVSDQRAVITWVNDEAHGGRSFFYRIQMVGSRPGPNGTVQQFALTHDPTIHNDPPS